MPAKKSNKSMKKKGGSGAAEHGIDVFGGIGKQGPISANDNTIAMKQFSGGNRKGGSMGVDIGAPLILTGLNQYMKRRSAKKGGKKVGGKCSLKGGKKHRMGDKSKKMMKKGKWGGKRRSMKKRSGKKMKGAGTSVGTNEKVPVFKVPIQAISSGEISSGEISSGEVTSGEMGTDAAVVNTKENKNILTTDEDLKTSNDMNKIDANGDNDNTSNNNNNTSNNNHNDDDDDDDDDDDE